MQNASEGKMEEEKVAVKEDKDKVERKGVESKTGRAELFFYLFVDLFLRCMHTVSRVDQGVTSVRGSESSCSNARLPSASLSAPIENRVTRASDDVVQASPSNTTHVNRLVSTWDAMPYNFSKRVCRFKALFQYSNYSNSQNDIVVFC